MMKAINILNLVLVIISLCVSDKPPLLSKNLWKIIGKHLKPRDENKLSSTDQKLPNTGAYENVKANVCPNNQEKWGFFEHTETEQIIVENYFGILPPAWNGAVSDHRRYFKKHKEMKHFIRCMAHCFDLSKLLLPAVERVDFPVVGNSLQYVSLIESLLDANIAVNDDVKDCLKVRNFLVHTASHLKQNDLARVLIRLGSDVNESNPDGSTVLHMAVLNDNVELTQILVEKGADIDVEMGALGDTALDIANKMGHTEIADLLQKANETRLTQQDVTLRAEME